MNIMNAYKTMPEVHKENIEFYYIYDGIYTVCPSISDEDAKFIFEICKDIENENVNPFSISHYLTDHFINGELTKDDLKKASSGEICSAVFMDDLSYFESKKEEMEEEIAK